jgi:hypothetical protein
MKHQKTARRGAAAIQRAATRTASLGAVSGQVIAQRMARAATGDHAENSRMLPEKFGAATLAGLVIMQHAMRMNMRMAGFATAEAFNVARAAQSMAVAATPAALYGAQFDFMQAWLPRWQAQSMQLGTAMIQSGSAALAPLQHVAAGNARRLAA